MINQRNISGLIILAPVLCLFMIFSGCKQAQGTGQTSEEPISEVNNVSEEKWGVQIQGIRLSAAGYMLDFRYKIMDPNKAGPLMDRVVKPYIIDEKTGSRFIVPAPPKVGSLRQKSQEPLAGKVYFIMFANPGKFLKQGDRVTVVVGDFRAQNLVVE